MPVPSEMRFSVAPPVMVPAWAVEKIRPSVWALIWPGAMSAVGPDVAMPTPPVTLASVAARFSE